MPVVFHGKFNDVYARPQRPQHRGAELARAGFTDTEAALRELDALPLNALGDDVELLTLLARVADPDLAVRNLVRLLDADRKSVV